MTQDTHPSKGAQEPVATRQILGEALVGLKFARGRLLQLWTDYHTRPKTSVIDGVIRRVEHALAAPPRDAASQTPTPDPKSQVTGDLDYWADVALENHTGREVALTRAEKAEADLARVTAERDKAIDERDDARSTLSAWFDLSTKTEEAVTPVLLDGLKGYLRTSKNGGMPTAQADTAYAVLEDFCRRYIGRELVPVVRGIAEADLSRLKSAQVTGEAEPVAWRMLSKDGQTFSVSAKPYHAGFAQMMEVDCGCVVHPLYAAPQPVPVLHELEPQVPADCTHPICPLKAGQCATAGGRTERFSDCHQPQVPAEQIAENAKCSQVQAGEDEA